MKLTKKKKLLQITYLIKTDKGMLATPTPHTFTPAKTEFGCCPSAKLDESWTGPVCPLPEPTFAQEDSSQVSTWLREDAVTGQVPF